VTAAVSNAGAVNPEVQKVSNKSLGGDVYQISAKELQPAKLAGVKTALQNQFGIKTFDSTSVGPTFGRTVANSAVVAIIASLLVISVYVALRFEWKFAVPVLIALMHDLLITSGVYALTGREVTTATVAALLTILGYSLYDTIIVFDRVRENIPRMPRAAFSQVVNRSMSEVLTRSIATTSCTLMPILALLLFGGTTLKDFAFALLIGVASGAYSSIFIASPVLTHWKERESIYRARRHRIEADLGYVPAYAESGSDVEPTRARGRRRPGRLTEPEAENVSAADFEQMKRDIAEEEREPSRHTSTLTKRLSRTEEDGGGGPDAGSGGDGGRRPTSGRPAGGGRAAGGGRPAGGARPSAPVREPAPPVQKPPPTPDKAPAAGNGDDAGESFERAPDVAENEGVVPNQKPSRPGKGRSRNRRHGRRR
jgi:SecD/SecF fusion protein